jgi:hypothetical protein
MFRSLFVALFIIVVSGATAAAGSPAPQPIPEPGTFGLLAAGLGAAVLVARRNRNRK